MISCRGKECACAMPLNMCKNFPVYFLIDWVRVYQPDTEAVYPDYYSHDGKKEASSSDSSRNRERTKRELQREEPPLPVPSSKNYWRHHIKAESLGCSTPSHPTSAYIRGNMKKYMKEGDSLPLKPVARGGRKLLYIHRTPYS